MDAFLVIGFIDKELLGEEVFLFMSEPSLIFTQWLCFGPLVCSSKLNPKRLKSYVLLFECLVL